MGQLGMAVAAKMVNEARKKQDLASYTMQTIKKNLRAHGVRMEKVNRNTLLVDESDLRALISAGKLGPINPPHRPKSVQRS